MLNTQYANSPVNTVVSNNQSIDPETIYLTLVSQGKSTEERKKFCERLIAIHNINSTATSQIQIAKGLVAQELYPKFNNWVTRIFAELNINDIAKVALLFDVFDEYTNNQDKSLETIKIKVMQKIFATYGNNNSIELLRTNVEKLSYSIHYRKTNHIKSMLEVPADIENITTNNQAITNFTPKHIAIIHLLVENLVDISSLLYFFEINNRMRFINSDVNRLDSINKIMQATDKNYRAIANTIGDFLQNYLLQQKIVALL